MQLEELLALLGPTGITALGEDVRLRASDGSETATKAVVSLADGSVADVEIGTGQALLASPEPGEGDTLVIRDHFYTIGSVRKDQDGYFKCWFRRQ
ncbi:MAG: hypothetical protein AAGI89_15660 [Pseudomonadota bacterium]